MRTSSRKPPGTGLRLEAELLLCCARTCLGVEHAERVSTLLQAPLAWAFLLRTALRHGMIPLLYRHLASVALHVVPQVILAQLQAYVYAHIGHTLSLTDELLKLLRQLEAHGIPAVPYKGPALAAAAYGQLWLRPCNDLDLLVPTKKVVRAKDLLLTQGYQLRTPMTKTQEVGYVHAHYDYPFMRADGRVIVELHWSLTDRHFPFPLDLARLWERLTSVSLAGATVRSLPPEDLLLILCVHGAKHGWAQLKWVCDIAELIRVYQEIGWTQVMAQADRLRSRCRLWLGLFLAHYLLDAPLPDHVVQPIQADPAMRALATQVCAHMFREKDDLPSLVHYYGFPAKTLERRRDKLRYCLHMFQHRVPLSGRDRALLPRSAPLACLEYLLEPVRRFRAYRRDRSNCVLRR
jgi:hypothetical protein